MLPGKAVVVALVVAVLGRDISSVAGGQHQKGYPQDGGSTP